MFVNYKELETCVGNLQPYNHGSSHAVRYTTDDGTLYYDVYSYQTLIFRWNIHSGTVAYFDNDHYSSTTSHLQNIIKRCHPEVKRLTKVLLGSK